MAIRKPLLFFVLAFYTLNGIQELKAQCCSDGINLLANYNPDFQAPVTGPTPPGFYSDNTYSLFPAIGNYSIIVSRAYGSCSGSPEYDNDFGNATGRYLWYDTKASSNAGNPGIAWQPFDPNKPVASQKLISVLPNTEYVFNCYIRDIAREVNCTVHGAPIAGLRINGIDLGQIDLATVPGTCCPGWVLLCARWNSGSDTTAQLKIESRLGIDFTDLGIDDVFFGKASNAIQFTLGNDTALCPGQSLTLVAPSTGTSYLWSDGSKGNSLTVSTPGVYWLEVMQSNCTGRDTINVTVKSTPDVFSLGNDTTICPGTSVVLSPKPLLGGTYEWQDKSSDSSLVAVSAGKYWLTISNDCGSSADTINITILLPPSISLGPDEILCDKDSFLITSQPIGQGTIEWNTGSTDTSISITNSGDYTVSIKNICGLAQDDIHITFLSSPQYPFNNRTVNTCIDSSVILDAGNTGMTFLWGDGQTTQTIATRNAGTYSVTISNNGNCAISDKETVIQHSCEVICRPLVPNAFSPNGDGKNDYFKPLFNCPAEIVSFRIFDRWGELVFSLPSGNTTGWDGNYNSKLLPVGTYSYFVQYRFLNSSKTEIVKGNVTLIR